MKMLMVLLVSAVGLLAHPATVRHNLHTNLNSIIDLVADYNTSSLGDPYVRDVTDLAEGNNKCQDKFFCKVQSILTQVSSAKNITRNLRVFNNGRNVNCTEVLRGLRSSSRTQKPISILLEHLKHCCQYRNLNGLTTSSP